MSWKIDNDKALGIIFAFASAITYGAVSTLGKYALETASPIYISSIAYAIGAAILFGYKPKGRPPPKLIFLILAAGLIGAGFAPYLFFKGLSLTSATNASLLSNGEAVFTTILALLFFKERLNLLQIVYVLMIIAGLITVTTGLDLYAVSFFQGFLGNILVLSATFLWGIDNNISRIISQRMDPTIFTRYKNIIGSVFLTAILIITDPASKPTANSLFYIVLIGVFAVGLSTAFLMNALSKLGAIKAVMIFSTASIFGLIFAMFFLGEIVTSVQVVGAIIMFLGLYLLNRTKE